MKKKWRRLFVGSLILIFFFMSLMACGGSSSLSNDNSSTQSTENVTISKDAINKAISEKDFINQQLKVQSNSEVPQFKVLGVEIKKGGIWEAEVHVKDHLTKDQANAIASVILHKYKNQFDAFEFNVDSNKHKGTEMILNQFLVEYAKTSKAAKLIGQDKEKVPFVKVY